MIFTETKLSGAYVIEPQRFEDERGFFARLFSQRDFEERGLDADIVECNLSFNKKKGTLRGMHYQKGKYAQAKLIRCTKGSIYDCAIDLRQGSETFKQWVAVELTAENRLMFYVPAGLAHGFQTLEADTEVFYHMSKVYAPEHAFGVRWDDPAFAINWPTVDERTIIQRDLEYPDFTDQLAYSSLTT